MLKHDIQRKYNRNDKLTYAGWSWRMYWKTVIGWTEIRNTFEWRRDNRTQHSYIRWKSNLITFECRQSNANECCNTNKWLHFPHFRLIINLFLSFLFSAEFAPHSLSLGWISIIVFAVFFSCRSFILCYIRTYLT